MYLYSTCLSKEEKERQKVTSAQAFATFCYFPTIEHPQITQRVVNPYHAAD